MVQSSSDDVRYTRIDGIILADCSKDPHLSSGMTPVDSSLNGSLTEQQLKAFSKPSLARMESVDEITQTRNGNVKPIPVLHIPGEKGELAGLESEYCDNDADANMEEADIDTSPENMKKLHSKVSL